MNPHWVPNYPNNGLPPQQLPNIYNPNAHTMPSNSSYHPTLTNVPPHPSPYPPTPFNNMHAPPPPPPTHLFGYHTAHNTYPNWSPNVPAYSQSFPPVINTFQGAMPINNNTWIPNLQSSNPMLPHPPPPPQLNYMVHARKRLRPDEYLQQHSNKSHVKSADQGANVQNHSNTNVARTNRSTPQNGTEKNKKDSKHGRQDGSYKDLMNSKRILGRYGVSLPGESKKDIDKWVAERKRRWPSKKNVEKRLAEVTQKKEETERKKMAKKREKQETKEVSALNAIANDYGSSEEEGEEKKNTEKKQESNRNGKEGAKIEKLPKKGRVQKRRRKKEKRGKGRNGAVQQVMIKQSKRPSLLKQLLQNEIRQEQSTLLQAFRFLLEKTDQSQEEQ